MTRKVYGIKGISLLLALAVILTGFTIVPVSTEAASKAYINDETVKIGINQTITYSYYLIKRSKASYSFSSSKPSVAKVDAKGKVTGLKVGTTKIKITEKYNGKSKSIGTATIAVKKACLYEDSYYELETESGYYSKNKEKFAFKNWIMYQNPKATYTISSSNTKKVKISSKGVITYAKGVNGDKLYFIVKETYKGKTRTVGKIEATFYEPPSDDYLDEDDDEEYEDDEDDEDEEYDDDEYNEDDDF
jgi:hypothetical protein